jgi:hypothetical protein
VSFPLDLQAEDVEVIPEVSTNMLEWNGGPVTLVLVSEMSLGGTRTLVTYRASTPVGSPGELFVRLLVRAR